MAKADFFIPSGDPAADFDRWDFYREQDAQTETETDTENLYRYEWEEIEEWEIREKSPAILDRF